MLAKTASSPAIVTRAPIRPWEPNQYLRITANQPEGWTLDPAAATAFASMREATRAALRLPSGLRAFGLPLHTEMAVRTDLH
jgi:hypothetical protein